MTRHWDVHLTGEDGYRVVHIVTQEQGFADARSRALALGRDVYRELTGHEGIQLDAIER